LGAGRIIARDLRFRFADLVSRIGRDGAADAGDHARRQFDAFGSEKNIRRNRAGPDKMIGKSPVRNYLAMKKEMQVTPGVFL
jgi:hypothetical protein